MEFSIKSGSPEKQRTGCVVVGVFEGRKLSPSAKEIDRAAKGFLSEVLRRGDHDGKAGTSLLLHCLTGLPADRVLLVGLGKERELGESAYRKAIDTAIKALRATGTTEATFFLTELALRKRDVAFRIEQAVLAIMEGLYRFDRMKSKPPETKRALRKVALHVPRRGDIAAGEAAAKRARAISEGVHLARDLGNLPANVCTPSHLAAEAQDLARQHGLACQVLDQKDLEKLGMGAFLAVARGSRQPPKLIVLEHRGAKKKDAPPVVLVGKGVTFDTGGISLKPAAEMDEMKFDMCGAASVLGTMKAAALMKLPLNVVGIVPATENMPGGNAVKPGDIVTTMSGKTVEILNTDAEGRLILCDALTYAERYKPAAVVDIATLTGAMVIALGHVATGLFANSDPLARELVRAGEAAWDRAWHLPL